MKYEKNQYTEGVSICSFIIAGAFLWWGIESLMESSWIGLLWLGIGASIAMSQISAYTNRDKLKNAVKNEILSNPNASVDQINEKTGISKKDVRAIILDLKMAGQLQASFHADTGQLVPQSTTPETPDRTQKFCGSCGAEVSKNAQFCTYCGANLK